GHRRRSETSAPHSHAARCRLCLRQGTGPPRARHLMRRLHLRLYLTIVGTLVAFAISAAILWHFVAWPQGAAWSIETATHLSASMLDEVHAPALDQSVVDTLAGQLYADVVLLDENGTSPPISHGEPFVPDQQRRADA